MEKIEGDPGNAAETALEERAPSVLQKRPAELTTFVASLVLVAAELGIDLSQEALLAGFVIVGVLPTIVSHYVSLYTAALRG